MNSGPRGGKRRRLIIEKGLEIRSIDPDELLRRTHDAVATAFDLILDDEVRLTEEGRGDEIFLGRWLTDEVGRPRRLTPGLRQRILAALDGVLRSYLDGAEVPEIVHVQALASMSVIEETAVDRTKLLRGYHPRAQLLGPLTAVLLSAGDRLPPLGAWSFSTHAGVTGEDAEAYGTHKEPGRGACERLLCLDVVGGDSRAAVAMMPMVTGTRDDPASPLCTADRRTRFEQLESFGIPPPSAQVEHVQPLMELAAASRRLLLQAFERGSGVLNTAGIRRGPTLSSIPQWALVGPLAYGPYAFPADLTAKRYWPGTDLAALRAASASQIPMLALAFDSATLDAGEVAGIERMVLQGPMWAGTGLAQILSSAGRLDQVQGLHQEPASALAALTDQPQAQLLGVEFDPAIESALTLGRGLLLASESGRPGHASLLLHTSLARDDAKTPTGTLAWTSNVDLLKPQARSAAIIQAQLHRRALRKTPPLGDCVNRPFRSFELHKIKTGDHATRCYVRLLAMLANLGIVGESRVGQAFYRA